jgi:DNA-directed RNA polymerase specialized sigma24 family protein
MAAQRDKSASMARAMQTFAAMLSIVESLAEKMEKMSDQLELLCARIPPQQTLPAAGTREREFYTIKEVAALIGTSDKTVRRLQKRGFFKSSRALRTKQIPPSEIDRYKRETF